MLKSETRLRKKLRHEWNLSPWYFKERNASQRALASPCSAPLTSVALVNYKGEPLGS